MRTCAICLMTAVAFLAGVAGVSCSSDAIDGGGSGTRDAEADAAWLVKGDIDFAMGLYGQLASRDGNIFFSPHSIYSALAMTYMGARGATASQMSAVLGFGAIGDGEDADAVRKRIAGAFHSLSTMQERDQSGDAHTLAEANALWCQQGYPFLDNFLSLNREGFGAKATLVDFANNTEAARQEINTWVEEETYGKIKDLVGPGDLDPLVRLVLTNAVYFKGMWDTQFDPKSTHDTAFHTVPGDPARDVTVPMMSRKGDYLYGDLESAGAQVVQLPYEGGDAAMLVMLPYEDLPGGLSALEAELTRDNLDQWLGELHKTEILVSIPKFEMTWGTENVIPELQVLGITDLFSNAADLSGMDGTTELYVSKVLHKAFVEVNEEGTEAAAATAVVTRLKAMMPLEFRADRPFIFLIRDTLTGNILFMGRLTDPTA